MIDIRVDIDTGTVLGYMQRAFSEAALEMARIIYADSQKLVPVDTGRLKASGRVEFYRDGRTHTSDGSGSAVRPRLPGEAAVVYGGRGVPYAAAVHDGVRGTGVKGESVPVESYKRGQSQYLRDAAMQAQKLLRAGADVYKEYVRKSAKAGYKSVRAVRDFGPGGGPGSGGDVRGR